MSQLPLFKKTNREEIEELSNRFFDNYFELPTIIFMNPDRYRECINEGYVFIIRVVLSFDLKEEEIYLL